MFFQWISRDGKLIIAARSVISFAFGFAGVFLAIYLDRIGFSLGQIGAFLAAGVAGSSVQISLVGLIADRIGKRRMMVWVTMSTAVAALALVAFKDFWLLTAFTLIGCLAPASGIPPAGAAQTVEQATLTDAVAPHRRTDVFAVYRVASQSSTALGSLAAGLPDLFQRAGLDELLSFQIMLAVLAAFMVVASLLYSALSSDVEGSRQRQWTNPLALPSRGRIFTLVGLFSVDAFAGSLVVQSLVAYWFNDRFGLDLASLAVIFFVSQALAAVSMWVAAELAKRIGLVNTMVFTHIPSSLFTVSAVFAPTAWLAVLFWQLRSLLAMMDVPTRDSYTMAVVEPEERVTFVSMMGLGRMTAGAIGPIVASTLWQTIAATAPFVLCVTLRISYDLALWFQFRKVRPPEEEQRRLQRQQT